MLGEFAGAEQQRGLWGWSRRRRRRRLSATPTRFLATRAQVLEMLARDGFDATCDNPCADLYEARSASTPAKAC